MKKILVLLLVAVTSSLSAKAFHLLILADNKDPKVGLSAALSNNKIEMVPDESYAFNAFYKVQIPSSP